MFSCVSCHQETTIYLLITELFLDKLKIVSLIDQFEHIYTLFESTFT